MIKRQSDKSFLGRYHECKNIVSAAETEMEFDAIYSTYKPFLKSLSISMINCSGNDSCDKYLANVLLSHLHLNCSHKIK